MFAVPRAVRIMSNHISPDARAGRAWPAAMPCDTTRRRPGSAPSIRSAKNGAMIRLRAGSSASASAMSFSMVDRMMHPARQTRAISGRSSVQPNRSEAPEVIVKPCA